MIYALIYLVIGIVYSCFYWEDHCEKKYRKILDEISYGEKHEAKGMESIFLLIVTFIWPYSLWMTYLKKH